MDNTTPTSEPAGASKPKRRPRETRELKVKYEIVVVDGEEGRRLHQIQSQAVFEAILWLATRRKASDGDHRNRVETPTHGLDDR